MRKGEKSHKVAGGGGVVWSAWSAVLHILGMKGDGKFVTLSVSPGLLWGLLGGVVRSQLL